ncbi:MAG TPA: quinone-dependent dihydroorotate dehydrogenase [Thermomicrobiales bacterium]|nr:quinone-dependent dihydroorotate dehydrogenase [Thermomicrobiales bacterium]
MVDLYGPLYRNVAAHIDAERSHHLSIAGLAAAARTPGGLRALSALAPPRDDRLRLRLLDLPFANPVGVAAGLDKNAQAVEALIALGFGHVEVGTVTLRPQPGNHTPRVWRAIEQQALVNAMGFPSDGAASVRARLLRLRPRAVIGVNIGKNRDTSLEDAATDYADLVSALFDVANYFTVNVSSPNTPGLRSLQLADGLAAVLARVNEANLGSAAVLELDPRPILVKIAPDLVDSEIEAVAEAAISGGASGIVATNTTTSRDGLPSEFANHPGGVSGEPLRERANHVTRVLYRRVGNRLPIVGVGGIMTGEHAVERIRSGATLVQVYTGFTYRGPAFAATLVKALIADADATGWGHITDIVGLDA